jgi:hypothetical protein
MHVKSRQSLDARRAVMELMNAAPQRVGGMGQAVPAIGEQAGRQENDQGLRQPRDVVRKRQNGVLADGRFEQPAGEYDNPEIGCIQRAGNDSPSLVTAGPRSGRNDLSRENNREERSGEEKNQHEATMEGFCSARNSEQGRT